MSSGQQHSTEAAALGVARQVAFRADLVDLTMPRMNGAQTLVEIDRLRSRLPVILITGYDATHADRLLQGVKPAARLDKPCTLDVLRSTLEKVLAFRESPLALEVDWGIDLAPGSLDGITVLGLMTGEWPSASATPAEAA